MNERLLQFIWQFQYFNKRELQTANGESLQIIQPGQYNVNQGPDFLDARIKIGDTLLAGNIELHIEESDWYRHAHQQDPNYRNIILHVLWRGPQQHKLSLPTIALQDRVSSILLERYAELMYSNNFVPCSNNLHDIDGLPQVSELSWLAWKERLLVERLIRKTGHVQDQLDRSGNNWEEVCWWVVARNFGTPINTDAFEAIAHSLQLKLLGKHRSQLFQLEALLLGQAGLLNQTFRDDYASALAQEYAFYRKKYNLTPLRLPVHFLRMRPGNFPTLRLAQLSTLLHTNTNLFSQIIESRTLKEVMNLFQVTASSYWDAHYQLDDLKPGPKKSIGPQMAGNIVINTVAPMLFAYGQLKRETRYRQKALDFLEQLPPEKNAITQEWMRLGVSNQDAWDSQALIELKKSYCDAKRCLECGIGNGLLAQPSQFSKKI